MFAGGNLFVAVLGGLAGLIQARWIAPEVLGEFSKFGILTAYLNFGMVLVHDGVSRQFPFLLGQGNKAGALQVVATAKWWYLLLSWSFTLLFLGLTLTSVLKDDYRAAVGWGVQIPAVWVAIYGAYLGVLYRTSSEFKRLAHNSTVTNVAGFVALVIVKLWGYWGLAARNVLANMLGLYLARRFSPVKVKAVFSRNGMVALAKISLPLSIPGYISTSCLSASLSLIVLQYCGHEGLGIYGMALAFQSIAMTLTAAIQQMFITKLTYKYGETGDVAACLHWAKRPTLLSVSAAILLTFLLCLSIGPFIRHILPRYEAAIPVIRILALQLPLSAAALPLMIFSAALWYKSRVALVISHVGVCLTAVAFCPKTLTVIATCTLLGNCAALILGFCILQYKSKLKYNT